MGDVLLHLPRAYQRFVRVASLVQACELSDGQGVIVEGHIRSARVQRTRRHRYMALEIAVLRDGSGELQLRWFIPFRGPLPTARFEVGQHVVLRGFMGSYGSVRILQDAELCSTSEHEHIVPVYPLTRGISQRLMQSIVQAALALAPGGTGLPQDDELPVPQEVGGKEIVAALRLLHGPRTLDDAERGRRILAARELRELVQKNLIVAQGPKVSVPMPEEDGPLTRAFLAKLPFQPTGAQRRAMREIAGDMSGRRGMRRVLSGDVGSGKSLVIAYALLRGIDAGGQSLLIAPTRILARQHAQTMRNLLADIDVEVALLTSDLPSDERRDLMHRIGLGKVPLVIATHLAFDEDLQFSRLLVGVIDEQHRFGVAQRLALERKSPVHTLWVSATPIPKTMAQIVYGAVPVSYLDERPPGRQRVETRWLPYAKRREVYKFVDREVRAGGQAYVVCPAIDEVPEANIPGARQVYEELRRAKLGGRPIALVHGSMTPEEQDAALEGFMSGKTGTLVATSVVEVGVDVPEATVMVVEGAERFGLAQLHQLRGRVGRGTNPSYALLLSDGPTTESRARLHALRELDDGFQLAEADLKLRGPGEFAGLRQSGTTDLRFVDLARDIDLFRSVMASALSQGEMAGPLRG